MRVEPVVYLVDDYQKQVSPVSQGVKMVKILKKRKEGATSASTTTFFLMRMDMRTAKHEHLQSFICL